jgi:hypothetical protein
MIFDFEDEFDWGEYFYRLKRPWQSLPQYRLLKGQFLPEITKESLAVKGTYAAILNAAGLGTRATVGYIVAQRYVMPAYSAAFLYFTTPLVLFELNREIIESQPPEEQPSMWRSLSQAITGTGPGAGSWTPPG